MKTPYACQKPRRDGSALMLTIIITGVALAILGSAMTWSASTVRLNYRSIQYQRSVAAAEAATEKVLSGITRDYLSGGEAQVSNNLASYRQLIPTTADSAGWADWEFNDACGNTGRTCVQLNSSTNYLILNSTYIGLRGFATSCTLVSNARQTGTSQNVVGGVYQQIQLARIPIFQFALYSSGDMEVGCGQPFNITGRVHANKELYVEPDSLLTFQSDVTAVKKIQFQRDPLDTRSTPAGSVVYQEQNKSNVAAFTLPIGTNNTPEAVREIIQPPPPGGDTNLALGQLRYYNQADMILVVSNSGITGTSGKFNNFATTVPSNQLAAFVSTNTSFVDAREGKTVKPINIDVGALKSWSETNTSLRVALGSKDVSSVYVLDNRTLAATNLSAVRVINGQQLPSRGLTIVTDRPLYVLGNYNAVDLGTTNTANTLPASLVGDAITVLSTNWSDANSGNSLSWRNAASTTVNAAFLAGAVETVYGNYSGGMENFPRFLESWGTNNVVTYNGSMIKMFPSLFATNRWGKSNVYDPPKRDWAFDVNFYNPTKLPPLTPSLQKVIRGQWASLSPNRTTVP